MSCGTSDSPIAAADTFIKRNTITKSNVMYLGIEPKPFDRFQLNELLRQDVRRQAYLTIRHLVSEELSIPFTEETWERFKRLDVRWNDDLQSYELNDD